MLIVSSLSIRQRLGQILAFRNAVTKGGKKSMSSHPIDESNVPVQEPSFQSKGGALRGALIGLIPLGLLIVLVTATFLLTALARQLAASSGFFAQQQAALIVLIVGLVLALVVYVVAIVLMLRRVTAWQQSGKVRQAHAALLALGATALVVLFPALLAIELPQHPAL
jgi:uncharacterized membrane protein YhaH (DUF805 family)